MTKMTWTTAITRPNWKLKGSLAQEKTLGKRRSETGTKQHPLWKGVQLTPSTSLLSPVKRYCSWSDAHSAHAHKSVRKECFTSKRSSCSSIPAQYKLVLSSSTGTTLQPLQLLTVIQFRVHGCWQKSLHPMSWILLQQLLIPKAWQDKAQWQCNPLKGHVSWWWKAVKKCVCIQKHKRICLYAVLLRTNLNGNRVAVPNYPALLTVARWVLISHSD